MRLASLICGFFHKVLCLMKGTMQYKCTPNLQTMAMVSKAVSLWNQIDIDKKVRCFFRDRTYTESRLKWEYLTKEVIDSLETEVVLPKVSQSHLANTIRAEFKYCLDEYIHKLHVQEQQPNPPELRLPEQCDQLYYQKTMMLRDVESLFYLKILMRDDVMSHTAESMFKVILRLGNKFAVKYFWDKLNENEKSEHIETSLQLAMEKFKFNWDLNGGPSYKTEQYIEICLFLINNMSESQRNHFFRRQTPSCTCLSLLKMILSTWPWQPFFIPTIEEMWSCLDKTDYKYLLYDIINKLKNDYEIGYGVENNIHQRILHETWNKTPDNLKQSTPYDVIFKLVSISDYSSVNLIINDQVMSEKSFNTEYMTYIESIKKDNHDVIDKMIKTKILGEKKQTDYLLETNKKGEENHHVMDKMNLIDRLITYYQYDLADKLIDWELSSEEERRHFKYLDPIVMYRYFILTKNHEMADLILEWRFYSLPNKWLCLKKKDKINNPILY